MFIHSLSRDLTEFEFLFADVTGVGININVAQSFSRFSHVKEVAARAFKEIDADDSGELTFNEIWEAREILCGHHRAFHATRSSPAWGGLTQSLRGLVGAKQAAKVIKRRAASLVSDRDVRALAPGSLQDEVSPNAGSPLSSLAALEEAEGGEGDDNDDDNNDDDDDDDMASFMTNGKLNVPKVLLSSFWQMGLGTALVLLFSDPMVSVLQECGDRLGISPFYIAFVMAPLASNASELIASFNASRKKTAASITTSLQQLLGAAVMNK